MKRILVINGNPKPRSLGKTMAERYTSKARVNHEVKIVHIGDMDFNLNLGNGYDSVQPLEADLTQFQQYLIWAEHIVIISPVWWGSIPAKLKGIFDRVLLPGYAFNYHAGKTVQEKLLTGRTSRLIFTLDTPYFWYKWVQRNPVYSHLKRTILDFVGIKNKSAYYFGPVVHSDETKRERWLKKIDSLAESEG